MVSDVEPMILNQAIAVAVVGDRPFVRDKRLTGIENTIKNVPNILLQLGNDIGEAAAYEIPSLEQGLIRRICQFDNQVAPAQHDDGKRRLREDLLQSLFTRGKGLF